MVRKDKLKIIHNTFKLLAPNKEYDLSDYDVFIFRCDGYVQIFSIHKSIYIETNSGLPPEVLALFKVCEVSDVEADRVYDIIERRNELVEVIGTPCDESILYKATPIDRNLFKTI